MSVGSLPVPTRPIATAVSAPAPHAWYWSLSDLAALTSSAHAARGGTLDYHRRSVGRRAVRFLATSGRCFGRCGRWAASSPRWEDGGRPQTAPRDSRTAREADITAATAAMEKEKTKTEEGIEARAPAASGARCRVSLAPSRCAICTLHTSPPRRPPARRAQRTVFDVAAGETLAILGPSGSGKSTLIICCCAFMIIRRARSALTAWNCRACPGNGCAARSAP